MAKEEKPLDQPTIPDGATPAPTAGPEQLEPGRSGRSGKGNKAKKEEAGDEEMVPVPLKDLKAILERQDAQAKEIERLTAAADLNRLANYDAKNQGSLIRVARLNTWKDEEEDKIILGWKMIKDDVRLINGVLHEEQIVRLFLDEGEGEKIHESDVSYRDFGLNMGKLAAEIIEKAENAQGLQFFVLRLPSGREIRVDTRFVN